jgi:hypothetical protein
MTVGRRLRNSVTVEGRKIQGEKKQRRSYTMVFVDCDSRKQIPLLESRSRGQEQSRGLSIEDCAG